jgi:hypothetical protein
VDRGLRRCLLFATVGRLIGEEHEHRYKVMIQDCCKHTGGAWIVPATTAVQGCDATMFNRITSAGYMIIARHYKRYTRYLFPCTSFKKQSLKEPVLMFDEPWYHECAGYTDNNDHAEEQPLELVFHLYVAGTLHT